MSEQESLAPLLTVIRDLLSWLDSAKVAGVVIGGVAASLLGRPRVTRDVDIVILLDENRWGDFLMTGAEFGFVPRRKDALDFAKKSRVLLMHHVTSGIDVDVSIGALPFEKEMVENAKPFEVAGQKIPLPSPEDLVIMKAVAYRPRDLADIEAIADAHPHLNNQRILKWVRDFATVLEMPEMYRDLQRILGTGKKRKKRKR